MSYGIELFDMFGNSAGTSFRACRLVLIQSVNVSYGTSSISGPSGWIGAGSSQNGFAYVKPPTNTTKQMFGYDFTTTGLSLDWYNSSTVMQGAATIYWLRFK